jgi:hypothetical protein
MSQLLVARTEKEIAAEPERVRAFLSDYRNGRPRILPPEYFSDYRVEEGGRGAGTVIGYRLRAGGRERPYRMRVEEPVAGGEGPIVERDERSSFVTSWALSALRGGERTLVTLQSSWEGAGGIGGFFERLFAPRALRRIQADVLAMLQGAIEEDRP